jgi:UDPglucose 6-dehydrogenase
VLVRHHGRTTLLRFEELWRRLSEEHEPGDGVIEPAALEVLTLVPEKAEPEFLPVMAATRRGFRGELVDVRTKMGRRVRCTPDHPWVVSDGDGGARAIKVADDLTKGDWLPLPLGGPERAESARRAPLAGAVEAAGLSPGQVIVRPPREQVDDLCARPIAARREVFGAASAARRTGDVRRTGALRLDELARADLNVTGSTMSSVRNGQYVPAALTLDQHFWRIVGLYIAEGHTTSEPGGRRRICWSFHPTKEEHLVEEVVGYWRRHGVEARVHHPRTATTVSVSSRILAAWWTRMLGLGRNSYGQRLPDMSWDRPASDRWALLSGIFEGDGSWSLIGGGPSVVLELGSVSDELADGVLRMLAGLGVVGGRRVGRGARSTKDTHWLRVSGADQVERAIELVPQADRAGVLASVARQAKRIAPTGFRRFDDGSVWVRVTETERRPFDGHVYSLEVPLAHTFVTSGGLTTHNCFPKDVSALKQLAGNSGYHFQLLTAVIEVNELQKRRTIGKLQKHLGSLVGKEIALLGVAFKPNTDDVREATSLVLAARLQSEGANVRVYDPVAADNASELLGGASVCGSALEALDGADAAVLVTEWPEFAELDWNGTVSGRMANPLVVDGRNFLDREALVAAGFTYEGIGR